MSTPSGDVLVVHPNAGRRAVLASAIPSHRVVAVESLQEATRRMVDLAPLLIIAPPEDARGFLRQVEVSAPNALRVFICSQADAAGLEELMQSAAEGHVFSILDDTLSGPELGRTITHLLQHRGSASILLPDSFQARFQVKGRSVSARCLEMSNFGATLQVPIDMPLTTFLPGVALEALCIEREERAVFQTAWAHVQQARPVHGDRESYVRLEVSWGTALLQPPQAPSVTVEEPAEVLATLRKALRRESLMWLQPEGDASVQALLESPAFVQEQGRELMRGRLASGLLLGMPGDVVHLSFEMAGQSHSGVCSLLDTGPEGMVTMHLPRSLTLRNWRGLPRFRPRAEHRFLVSFVAPVTGQRTTRSVLDLSSGGLSFPFDASSEILPAGLLLDASLLLPDGSEVECALELRSIQFQRAPNSTEAGLRPFRAGARFIHLPARGRQAILEAFLSARCPEAINGGLVPFSELWRLMDDARYRFHPDYLFSEPTNQAVLGDTHRKLYVPGELGRSLVYRTGGQLIGHLAGLRSHSRTWLLQHLCVRPGFHRNQWISYELSTSLVEFGESMEEIEFIRYSWRRDNRWPNRFGSWLARVMDGQGLSLLRHFHYMRLALPCERSVPSGLPPVREALHSDRLWLEHHLCSRGEWVRVLAEDLRAEQLSLEALGQRFAEHGLHRGRRLFLVDGEEAPLALALAEEGSPGLNLIETTNAFWLIVPEREHPRAREAVRALIERCVEHARARGRPSAIGFMDSEDAAVCLEAGFSDLGTFSEWIFHRSMARRWCELWKSVFERFVDGTDIGVMYGVEEP